MTSSSTNQKKRKKPIRRILLYTGLFFLAAIFIFIVAPLAWWRITAPEYDGYNYYTYHQGESNRNYIEAGTPFPADLDVYTPDGEAVPIHTLWQDKPLVLETASNSCPIYWDSEVTMSSLIDTYGNEANITVLYTREAHPGMLAPSHRSLEDKLGQARKMQAGLRQRVYVDDKVGTLHQQLGGGPNSVYIIGTDGIVSYYAYWNDPAVTRDKLKAIVDAGGVTTGLDLSSNPCRDPTKAREGFNAEMMRTMVLGVITVGGLDALVDFMSFMFSGEGGEDPLCKIAEQ